jgi:hypothetical protein
MRTSQLDDRFVLGGAPDYGRLLVRPQRWGRTTK